MTEYERILDAAYIVLLRHMSLHEAQTYLFSGLTADGEYEFEDYHTHRVVRFAA